MRWRKNNMDGLLKTFWTQSAAAGRRLKRVEKFFLLFAPREVRHTAQVRIFWVTLAMLIGFSVSTGNAATFNLTTGETLVGDLLISSANDVGVQIRLGDGGYKRIPWASFSQDDLKKMVDDPKLQPFVEPFIEVTLEERLQRTEVRTVPPPRLELPPERSLFAAMFSSGLGIFIILLLYAANLFAAYEVSVYRAQSTALVCGVSAVLPFFGPIIFLAIPTKVKPTTDEQAQVESAAGAAATGEARPGAAAAPRTTAAVDDDDNPMHPAGAQAPAGLRLAHEEPAKPKHLPTTTYQRGQFTFNRRFFETRFAGFFGVVRRDAEKDMVLAIKSSRGEFVGNRISRIASNDLHLQVEKGGATEEVIIPFNEIQEIRHKHKDA
jgi:hypothetical protein